MPIKFAESEQVKSTIDTYTVDKVLNQGAFAHSARARSLTRGGRAVFLKRYFSPTQAKDWYRGFVDHQQRLKQTISVDAGLKQYCYGFIDFFEGTEGRANRTFHQVFEFIENGKALTAFIEEFASEGPAAQWERRVTFARVLMMAMAALHTNGIVHTDLKPDNLLLVPNPVSAGEYNLKVIDLDWAIFSGSRAPWHGELPYVGTPGYWSPEHAAGEVPGPASDVFTCALILGELLGGGHPFVGKRGDDERYNHAIRSGEFARIGLQRPIDKIRNQALFEEVLNRAMDPRAARRPTAEQLRDALFGRGDIGKAAVVEVKPPPVVDKPAPTVAKPADAEKKPPATKKPATRPTSELKPALQPGARVELRIDDRPALSIGITTDVGRQMLKPVSPDAQFYSDPQFRIARNPAGAWTICAAPDAINETLVDGKRLTTTVQLRDGMRIAVGNASKGIEKLPLIVRLA